MTGEWETKLRNLASSSGEWQAQGVADLQEQLGSLAPVLQAAMDHGLTGAAGVAATASLQAVENLRDLLTAQSSTLSGALTAANKARHDAQQALDNGLPEGQLDAGRAAQVDAIAIGATIFMGPISVIAGPTAVNAVNAWMSGQREAAAKKAYEAASTDIDNARKPLPTKYSEKHIPDPTSDPGSGSGFSVPMSGMTALPAAAVSNPSIIDHTPETGDGSWTGGNTLQPPATADGPISSGTTGLGSLGGGGGSGLLGAGGLGGAGGTALAGGVGAVAALGADRLVRGGLGTLGGAGKLGGLGTVGGATADAEGSGGLLGNSKGAAGAKAGAAAEGAEGRSGAPGMMGGGGGQGGGNREKRAGRGLGGPIAPKLEDDPDAVPRSAAAGPGGRG